MAYCAHTFAPRNGLVTKYKKNENVFYFLFLSICIIFIPTILTFIGKLNLQENEKNQHAMVNVDPPRGNNVYLLVCVMQ